MKPLLFKVPLFAGRVRVFFSLEDFHKADPSTVSRGFRGYDAFFWELKIGFCIVFIKYSESTLAYLVDRIFDKVQKHYKKESTHDNT